MADNSNLKPGMTGDLLAPKSGTSAPGLPRARAAEDAFRGDFLRQPDGESLYGGLARGIMDVFVRRAEARCDG